MPLTTDIFNRCFGYVLGPVAQVDVPVLCFESPRLAACDADVVPHALRPEVQREVAQAYTWCAERFPPAVHLGSAQDRARAAPTISRLTIGMARHSKELLSSSSPQSPGDVFLAACWPLSRPHRLGSLIAHEAVHQALYGRERTASPLRPGALGYSPFRLTVRPGRWVWHAFWTFVLQCALLTESVAAEPGMIIADPTLLPFIQHMAARVGVCRYSLEIFRVVDSEELERCRICEDLLQDAVLSVSMAHGYSRSDLNAVRAEAFQQFEEWSDVELSANAGIVSP